MTEWDDALEWTPEALDSLQNIPFLPVLKHGSKLKNWLVNAAGK